MREHFTQELEILNQEILRMTVLVEENIAKALRAWKYHDESLAQQVIADDKKVDAFEMTITDRCVSAIATEQPVAGDLRRIVSLLKAVRDIERIGDCAVHAAKGVKNLSSERPPKPQIDISKMLALGNEMLREAVNSLITTDVILARSTAKRDLEMDDLTKQVHRDLLCLMSEDKSNLKWETRLLLLSRLLERLGDHAVNICSLAVYAATGGYEDL